MAKVMREKVLTARVRMARMNPPARLDGTWADRYAKDVEPMRQMLTAFVIADVARAISMDDYPGLTKAEKRLFEVRLKAQHWLGAKVKP